MQSARHIRLVGEAAAGKLLTECTDDELMQLAGLGQESAFACLVLRYQASVRAFCARSCGGNHGDDVAQDVFVALFHATPQYIPDGRFRGFLFTIAARRCKNATRGARARREDLLSVERVREDANGSLEEVLSEERRRRLFALVDELPEAQRRAIHMRFSAGLDYAEVAGVMGCSEPTARTRVHLGLEKLRALCAKRGEL